MSDFIPSLEHLIYQFLQRPDYRPLKQHELIRALDVPASARRELRRVLTDMERRGQIVRLRKNRWSLPDTRRTVTGTLSAHSQGFGFVTRDTPGGGDIFIAPRRMGAALHGDRVSVEITTDAQRRPRRRGTKVDGRQIEGRIAQVVERRTNRLAGLYKRARLYTYVIPDNPRILQNVRITEIARHVQEPEDGYQVVVELDEWTNPGEPLTGTLVEVLGPADAPGVQMASLIRGYGLDETFPDKIERAARDTRVAMDSPGEGRRDLRDGFAITIDPVDARDYDDAVSLRRLPDGHWELGVHIADVAHYVKSGSEIDREAYHRGNSVYLVDRVITMLPPYLTEQVCSLVPQQDRLTHTVRMTLDAHGKVLAHETFPSIIHSRARLDYDQVQRAIKGHDRELPPEQRDLLRDMHHLAQILRKRRRRAGAILFTMPEVYCALDGDGRVTDIRKRTSYEAYQLIEEFMLLANRTVARLLAEKQVPALYRIHEPPDEEQWERMAVELQEMGILLAESTSAAMNEIAADAAGTPREHAVNLMMLRNLKRAVYSAERKEHFGLAFSHYLHFTSPIRRYPDLAVHRALKAVENGSPPPYNAAEMAEIAAQCTRTERNADDAEQESVTLKRVEYYRSKLDAGDTGPYPAVISSIVSRGFIVELTDTLQRGLLPFASIRHDHVRPHPRRTSSAQGARRSWSIGDPVDVELVRVDTTRRLVDFRLAGEPAVTSARSKHKKTRGKHKK